MPEMKTLTINGVTYRISDPEIEQLQNDVQEALSKVQEISGATEQAASAADKAAIAAGAAQAAAESITIEELGAAPAGFGVGTVSYGQPGTSVADKAALDELTQNGFWAYRNTTDPLIENESQTRYVNGITLAYLKTYVTQIAFCVYNGTCIERHKIEGVWEPWHYARSEESTEDGRSFILGTDVKGGNLLATAAYKGTSLTLDSIAYSGKTYREIFSDGSIIKGGDFESDMPSIGGVAGTYSASWPPSIQSDVSDLGYGSLKVDTTENTNPAITGSWITLPSYTFKAYHTYYLAFRGKVDEYTQGRLGIEGFRAAYIPDGVTLGAWVTGSSIRYIVEYDDDGNIDKENTKDIKYPTYVGCMDSEDKERALLKGYIDNVCMIDLTEIFGDDAPDKGQMDVLYERYLQIMRGTVPKERKYVIPQVFGEDFSDKACRNAFMTVMNQRASRLGMKNSVFITPSGLPVDYLTDYTPEHITYKYAANNISTASDAMKLIFAAYGNDKVADILRKLTYTFQSVGDQVRTYKTTSAYHNGKMPGVLKESGFHLFGGKGGSLSGSAISGNGGKGILNAASLCGYGNKQAAVVVMGQFLYKDDGTSESIAPIVRDVLKKLSGSTEATPDLDAAISRTSYPVSVCACDIPSGSLSAWSEVDTDALLSNNNSYIHTPNKTHALASVSKLLTALLVVEYIDDLHDLVEIHESDFVGGSGQKLATGAMMSYSDLLHLMLMESNNQAATALARAVGRHLLMNGISVTY